MSEVPVLLDGRVFGEQPRWHDDRLWFADWGTQEVIAVDLGGNSEVMLKGRSVPAVRRLAPRRPDCSSSQRTSRASSRARNPTARYRPMVI